MLRPEDRQLFRQVSENTFKTGCQPRPTLFLVDYAAVVGAELVARAVVVARHAQRAVLERFGLAILEGPQKDDCQAYRGAGLRVVRLLVLFWR